MSDTCGDAGQHDHRVGHGAEAGGDERFAGAQIPEQPYAHDDGTTPPEVAAALAAWDASGTGLVDLVTALLPSRLLVGLVAVLDSEDPTGAEKDSHMAAAMVVRPDGHKALVAFTSAAGMAAWHAEARPLPVSAVDAARAAISDGADTLLVDARCPISGRLLWALAEGRVPSDPVQDPQVRTAVEAAIAAVVGEAGLPTDHSIGPGDREGEVLVLLHPAVAAHRAVVATLAEALAADPVVRTRLDRGLQLGVAP